MELNDEIKQKWREGMQKKLWQCKWQIEAQFPLESDFCISPNISYFLVPRFIESIGNSHVNNKNTLGVKGGMSRAVRPVDKVFIPFEVKALFFFWQCGKSTVHSVVVYASVSEESVGWFGWQQAICLSLKSEEQ